jgi:hypothetical protein
MTYSPLLLATAVGLAAASAVLFSLTATILDQNTQGKDTVSVSLLRKGQRDWLEWSGGWGLASSPVSGGLIFSAVVQTLLMMEGEIRNRPGTHKIIYLKSCLRVDTIIQSDLK